MELINYKGKQVYAINGCPNSPGFSDRGKSFYTSDGRLIAESRGVLWEQLTDMEYPYLWALYDEFDAYVQEVLDGNNHHRK